MYIAESFPNCELSVFQKCPLVDAGIHCCISHADLSCLILPLLRHAGGGRDL